jgi:Protein of unknown function (DUF4058)
MPLRDHFRPPVEDKHSWDELHGLWPAVIVLKLVPMLPDGFTAAPRVHLGTAFEIDVSTYQENEPARRDRPDDEGGGVDVAAWAPPKPTSTIEAELLDPDEYEVRIYDARHGRRLVAAIEIVSPANKDRPESRRAFVAKAAALIQFGVSVSIVDVVTIRHANLYAGLLEWIGGTDATLGAEPTGIYAVTVRPRERADHRAPLLDTWFHPLAIGRPLPTLPIWLDAELSVPLDLETGYEEACRALRIA